MFTENEIHQFRTLPREKSQLLIRSLWNERANKTAFRHLKTIHWRYPDDIESLISKPNYNSELSTVAQCSLDQGCQFLGGVGVLLSGIPTLVGAADLGTDLIKHGGKIIKVTSAFERLLFGDTDTVPFEITLSNWQITQLIIDYAKVLAEIRNNRRLNKTVDSLSSLASACGLPVKELN